MRFREVLNACFVFKAISPTQKGIYQRKYLLQKYYDPHAINFLGIFLIKCIFCLLDVKTDNL